MCRKSCTINNSLSCFSTSHPSRNRAGNKPSDNGTRKDDIYSRLLSLSGFRCMQEDCTTSNSGAYSSTNTKREKNLEIFNLAKGESPDDIIPRLLPEFGFRADDKRRVAKTRIRWFVRRLSWFQIDKT
jgi:hypothetical protein